MLTDLRTSTVCEILSWGLGCLISLFRWFLYIITFKIISHRGKLRWLIMKRIKAYTLFYLAMSTCMVRRCMNWGCISSITCVNISSTSYDYGLLAIHGWLLSEVTSCLNIASVIRMLWGRRLNTFDIDTRLSSVIRGSGWHLNTLLSVIYWIVIFI